MVTSLDDVKEEFRVINEELYKRNDEVLRYRSEIESLEQQMKIVENNQEGLQTYLVKLKAKNESHRVRATGAVCNSMPYLQVVSIGIRTPPTQAENRG